MKMSLKLRRTLRKSTDDFGILSFLFFKKKNLRTA